MLFHCSAYYQLHKDEQDIAKSSYIIDDGFTISESRPHSSSLPSIFSAVGLLLTVRAIINQNGSCVVDLFVGDLHHGQPFNRSGINPQPPLPQLSCNRSLTHCTRTLKMADVTRMSQRCIGAWSKT